MRFHCFCMQMLGLGAGAGRAGVATCLPHAWPACRLLGFFTARCSVPNPFLLRRAKLGKAPNPAPRWLGNALAWVLGLVGPKGLEFAKYSIGELDALWAMLLA